MKYFNEKKEPKSRKDESGNDIFFYTVDLNLSKQSRNEQSKSEWVEIMVTSTSNTRRTIRITFNWLVATSKAIKGEVSRLTRTCDSLRLRLVQSPTSSFESNVYRHPVSYLIQMKCRFFTYSVLCNTKFVRSSFAQKSLVWTTTIKLNKL